MIDLQFIETSNRWISETQVKIKSEVGANNQQAETFKKLVLSYRNQTDSILNPNLDKEVSGKNRDFAKDSSRTVLAVDFGCSERNFPKDYLLELRTCSVLEMFE